MVKVQKFLALILSMTLLLSLLVGCSSGSKADWALKIDGVEIPTGLYLSFQQAAYQNAKTEIAKEENEKIKAAAANGEDVDALQKKFDKESFLKKTIDGKSTEEWTTEETLTLCKRYVAAMNLAEDERADLTASDFTTLSSQLTTYYTPYATYYDYLGIGEKAYATTLEDSVRESNLFEHWYGEGGTDEVSEEEISDYFVNNYAKGVVYTVYGSSLEEDEIAHRQDLLNQAAEQLNNGESFGVVINNYETTIKEEEAAAKAESDAAAGISSVEESSEETAESVTDEAEAVDPTEDGESTEETTEEELPKITSYTQIYSIKEGSTYLSALVTNAISSDISYENYQVIKADGNLYLIARLELTGDSTDLSTYKTSVLQEMMEDPFKARLDEAAADFTVEKDQSALDYYTVKRFVKRYEARFGE